MILILELRLLFSEEQNVEVSDTCLPAGRQQKFNTCLPDKNFNGRKDND
jgi:hypothetical protein